MKLRFVLRIKMLRQVEITRPPENRRPARDLMLIHMSTVYQGYYSNIGIRRRIVEQFVFAINKSRSKQQPPVLLG